MAALALAALPASVAVDALLDRCVPLMRAVCGAVRAADAWRCSAYDARSKGKVRMRTCPSAFKLACLHTADSPPHLVALPVPRTA